MDDDSIVDTETFLLCRLCVSNKGKFQISPAMRKYINTLFGIDVNSFDGMSQILCGNCKTIITEMINIKDVYLKKQDLLLVRKRKLVANEMDLPPIGTADDILKSTVLSTMSMSPATQPPPPPPPANNLTVVQNPPAVPANYSLPVVSPMYPNNYVISYENTLGPQVGNVLGIQTPIIPMGSNFLTISPLNQNVTNDVTMVNSNLNTNVPEPLEITELEDNKDLIKILPRVGSPEPPLPVKKPVKKKTSNVTKSNLVEPVPPAEESMVQTAETLPEPDSNMNTTNSVVDRAKMNNSNAEPKPPAITTDQQKNVMEVLPASNSIPPNLYDSAISDSIEDVSSTRSTRHSTKYNCIFCVKVTLDGTQLKRHIHTHHTGLLNKLKALTVPCSVRMKNISSTKLPQDWVHHDSSKVYHYNPKDMYFFMSKQKTTYNPNFFNTSSEEEEEVDDLPFKNYKKMSQKSKKRVFPASRSRNGRGSSTSYSSYRDNDDDDTRSSMDSNMSAAHTDLTVTNQVDKSSQDVTMGNIHCTTSVVQMDVDSEEENETDFAMTADDIKECLSDRINNEFVIQNKSLTDVLSVYGLIDAMWAHSTTKMSISFSNSDQITPTSINMEDIPDYDDIERDGNAVGHLLLLQPPPGNDDLILPDNSVRKIVPKTEPMDEEPVNNATNSVTGESEDSNAAQAISDVASESSDIPYSCIDIKPEVKQEPSELADDVAVVGPKLHMVDVTDDETTDTLPLFRLKEVLKKSNIILVLCESTNRNVKRLMRLTLKLTVDNLLQDFFLDLSLRDDFVFVLLISNKEGVVVDISTWSESLQNHIVKSIQSEKFLSSLTILSPKFGKFSGPLLKLRDILQTFT